MVELVPVYKRETFKNHWLFLRQAPQGERTAEKIERWLPGLCRLPDLQHGAERLSSILPSTVGYGTGCF